MIAARNKAGMLALCLGLALITVVLCGCANEVGPSKNDNNVEQQNKEEISNMSQERMIVVRDEAGHEVSFELNSSRAAYDLLEQLPLETSVENYSTDEKIFYPESLDASGAPLADAKTGSICYFAPWGDVCIFYRDFGSASGLYELGTAVSGADEISNLTGTITVSAG